MTEKQFHQGSRLRFHIEKSGLTMVEVVEKSGIARSSMYDLYKKPELLRSKIQPILDAINIEADVFYGNKVDDNDNPFLKAENERLKSEKESLKRELELLLQQLADKEEIIQLLKNKRK